MMLNQYFTVKTAAAPFQLNTPGAYARFDEQAPALIA